MRIVAENLGKKFARDWIFRGFSFAFEPGRRYAITGNNGSGKTTLLKSLTGMQPTSEGQVTYEKGPKTIPIEDVFKHFTFTTPSLELIEEFTLAEQVEFYAKFRELTLAPSALLERMQLTPHRHKPIRFFSSGMKQKTKLGLALFTDATAIFLDEPTTNLDRENIAWYLETIHSPRPDTTLIISSNQPYEYDFCEEILVMDTYKPAKRRSV